MNRKIKNFNRNSRKRNSKRIRYKACQDLFQKAESDEILWIRFEGILNTEEENTETIEVSVITQSIMDYDQHMFSDMMEYTDSVNREENFYYRPYFLSFLIDVNRVKENSRFMNFLQNEENLHQWFRASFSALDNATEVLEFPGWLQSAASPIIYKGKTLVVENKYLSSGVVQKINNLYDLGNNYCSADSTVEKTLENEFAYCYFDEARVYSVGNGNCVYLHGKNWYQKKRLLFDIGYHVSGTPPRNPKGKKREKATRAIRNFRPDCIVLSHWDSDHYMGCAYASDRIFNCTWIAPDCHDASVNAKRLAKYLKIKNKLLLVTRGNGRIITDIQSKYGYFKLWMGSQVPGMREVKGITKANKEGLVIEVENNGIHTLMMGDVPYQSLPARLNFVNNNPFDYLIVPHHGANMNVNLLRQNSNVNSKLAIVCAERGKIRPHKDHEKALIKSSYTVKLTDEANLRIDLHLTKRYSFNIKN